MGSGVWLPSACSHAWPLSRQSVPGCPHGGRNFLAYPGPDLPCLSSLMAAAYVVAICLAGARPTLYRRVPLSWRLAGSVKRCTWGQRSWHGCTTANGITSLLFMVGHWWQHPPLWALAVLLPALLFGWLRDRYDSVYPPMTLHTVYNVWVISG